MKHGVRTLVILTLAGGLAAFVLSCGNRRDSNHVSRSADSATAAPTLAVNQHGEQGFLAYCAMCHGDHGAGDGPLAQGLKSHATTAPARLDDRARLDQLGLATVRNVIARGGAHTGRSNLMPAWGERLDAALIDSIADFVMMLPDLSQGTPSATIAKYLAAPPGTSREGRRLFIYYCSACHGPFGKGNGLAAEALRIKHNIRPRDLTDSTYFMPKTDRELYITVALGGGHVGKSTFMPAWTFTLSPAQIKDLVAYVRVLSRTTPRP